MKKKILLSLLCGIIVLGIATGCGSKGNNNKYNNSKDNSSGKNNKLFDAPYFGDITIGSITFNMASTDDEIEEKGMDKKIGIYKYEDKETDSYIYYDVKDFDNSFSINFDTYSSIYKDLGCDNCDEAMSTYIKLPKDITYDSTINDVIKAYGNPKSNELYSDKTQKYNDNNLTGQNFGELECYRLHYSVKNNKTTKFNLYLYFSKDAQKLYRVEYEINVDK